MAIEIKEGSETCGQNFGVEEKLDTCPHCKGEAYICQGGYPVCRSACVNGRGLTKQEAIKAWNTRVKNTEIEKDLTELFTKFPFVLSATRRKDGNGLKNVDELVKAVLKIINN